jgi:preprotein translocase subunit SecB
VLADLTQARRTAARVAARAEIKDVRVISLNAELKRVPGPGERLSYRVDTDANATAELPHLMVELKCDVYIHRGSTDGDDGGEDPAEIVAEIAFELAGLFRVDAQENDEPFTADEIQSYAVTTGQMALYPYARELVYDLTGRLALPPLTLGLFKIPLQERDVKPSQDRGARADNS